jgi:hypothetical protein
MRNGPSNIYCIAQLGNMECNVCFLPVPETVQVAAEKNLALIYHGPQHCAALKATGES